MKILVIVITVFVGFSVSLKADQSDENALEDTKTFLQNKESRDKYIRKDAKAKKADDFAHQVVGGDAKNLEEMYSITADILQIIVKKSNGSAEKMQQLMTEFQSNPESFYNELTPEQQKRIKALSRQISTTPKQH